MNGIYNATVSTVKKIVKGDLKPKKLQDSNVRIILQGFVEKIISTEQFTLFDGTDIIDIKIDTPHDVKEGQLVCVIALSNKSSPFRPMQVQPVKFGEQMIVHYLDSIACIKEETAEPQFADFIDNLATFD
ncbi:Conserved_hypothetical protein [Hexamita inflata]|uniref:Uncharacterized protein n=1 Tax=Hexamita inflata TaxID=28002 RepID=A0AA86U454_9EUKA|nr:Conserved hypothetical protein [Hexamita inflata]